jgi:hypothetical protein
LYVEDPSSDPTQRAAPVAADDEDVRVALSDHGDERVDRTTVDQLRLHVDRGVDRERRRRGECVASLQRFWRYFHVPEHVLLTPKSRGRDAQRP